MLPQEKLALDEELRVQAGGACPLLENQIPHLWSRHAITKLTRLLISFMSMDSLIELIEQRCEWLPQPAVREHLNDYDRKTLERLVYLVRQCCRNQEHSTSSIIPNK